MIKLRPTAFGMDCLGNVRIPGFTNAEKWNGWSCPYFTYDQACAFLVIWNKATKEWSKECPDYKDMIAYYDAKTDEFVIPEVGYVERHEATLIDGTKYYCIGANAWCWFDYANEYGAEYWTPVCARCAHEKTAVFKVTIADMNDNTIDTLALCETCISEIRITSDGAIFC